MSEMPKIMPKVNTACGSCMKMFRERLMARHGRLWGELEGYSCIFMEYIFFARAGGVAATQHAMYF